MIIIEQLDGAGRVIWLMIYATYLFWGLHYNPDVACVLLPTDAQESRKDLLSQ
jgi:hypothetical protein